MQTSANVAGTNGLTCLSKHGGARDNKFWSPILWLTFESVERCCECKLIKEIKFLINCAPFEQYDCSPHFTELNRLLIIMYYKKWQHQSRDRYTPAWAHLVINGFIYQSQNHFGSFRPWGRRFYVIIPDSRFHLLVMIYYLSIKTAVIAIITRYRNITSIFFYLHLYHKVGLAQHVFHHVVIMIRQLFLPPPWNWSDCKCSQD
jgi:hypothetical protein